MLAIGLLEADNSFVSDLIILLIFAIALGIAFLLNIRWINCVVSIIYGVGSAALISLYTLYYDKFYYIGSSLGLSEEVWISNYGFVYVLIGALTFLFSFFLILRMIISSLDDPEMGVAICLLISLLAGGVVGGLGYLVALFGLPIIFHIFGFMSLACSIINIFVYREIFTDT